MTRSDSRRELRSGVPASLFDARRIVLAAMVLGGGLGVSEVTALAGGNTWPWAFLVVGPPVVGWTFIAAALASGNRRRAQGIGVLTLVAHALIGLATLAIGGVVSQEGIVIGGIFELFLFAMVGVIASPVTIAAASLDVEQDLDKGDALLGYCGAWLAAQQTGFYLLFGSDMHYGPRLESAPMVLGIVLGGVALAVCLLRGIQRRRWCTSIMRGEVAGWRLRHDATRHELARLPCVSKSSHPTKAVIERVERRGAGYRGAVVGQAVATMRVPADHYLQALNEA